MVPQTSVYSTYFLISSTLQKNYQHLDLQGKWRKQKRGQEAGPQGSNSGLLILSPASRLLTHGVEERFSNVENQNQRNQKSQLQQN